MIIFGFFKKQVKKIIDSNFIFRNIRLPIRHKRINIFYWRPNNIFQDNVGDYLSKVLIYYLIDYYGIEKNKKVKETKFLMGIGSGLHYAKNNYVIWGSGLKEKRFIEMIKDKRLDIRCLRGPKTLELIKELGYDTRQIFLGDPAILLPNIYHPPNVTKKNKFGIIPYFRKEKEYIKKYSNVITPLTKNWKYFINEILKCEFVISASLHGIILSEAYGIPAIMLNDNSEESIFKFEDYYLSTGRENYKIANTVEEAIHMGPEKLPELKKMQENLLRSFPYDLWL
ncbi:MAG: polysaccharide pyruvyl transferase family protein [Bacteroidota bacterium]|nr:polysaccharide pyruvyl transferase family protein [Bacteroidota bacterium]